MTSAEHWSLLQLMTFARLPLSATASAAWAKCTAPVSVAVAVAAVTELLKPTTAMETKCAGTTSVTVEARQIWGKNQQNFFKNQQKTLSS